MDRTRWYGISVVPRKEKAAAQALRAKGYEDFLPQYTERRNWSDRAKVVDLPLFPGYVFCRLDPEFRLPILKIASVNQIVGFGKTPHPIEDAEIEALQKICKEGIHVMPCPYMNVGAKVTILQGPLKGLEGIMVTPKQDRLIVSVTLLQRSVSVELDRDWISPLRIFTELGPQMDADRRR